MVFFLLPDLAQIPHVVIAALAVASAVQSKYQRLFTVAFHAVIGILSLAVPSIIHGPELIGDFNPAHVVLQRLVASFHIGHAVFAFCNRRDAIRVEPIVHFSKSVAAFLTVLAHLFTAYQLYEDKARGLHAAPNFLGCVVLVYGVSFAAELYQLVQNQKSTVADEIDLMVKRTQRWIEGRTSRDTQNVFLADSALCLLAAFLWLTFPGPILRQIIKRQHFIDGVHELYARTIGCQWLALALISLSATQFINPHQQSYIIQRIVTHAIFVAMQLYGNFIVGVYSVSIIATLVILTLALAYAGLLVKTLVCLQHQAGDVAADGLNGPGQTTTFTVKRTTKAA